MYYNENGIMKRTGFKFGGVKENFSFGHGGNNMNTFLFIGLGVFVLIVLIWLVILMRN